MLGIIKKKRNKKIQMRKKKEKWLFKNNKKKIFVFSLGKCEKKISFYYLKFFFLLQPTCQKELPRVDYHLSQNFYIIKFQLIVIAFKKYYKTVFSYHKLNEE